MAFSGPRNRTGPQGPPGIDGKPGPKGEKGDMGPTGFTGPKGDNGTSGMDGADGVGVPPGGLTGYILAKASDADFDTEWILNTGGGTSDHGMLTGLGDDDHLQYHNDARALTWLGTRSTSDLPEGSNLYFTQERVEDVVGALFDDSSTVTFSYIDPSSSITATVVPNTTRQKVGVSLNDVLQSVRQTLNFIEGSGIDISVTDDNTNDEVDITITNSAASGFDPYRFIGTDVSGDLTELPMWFWNPDTNGANFSNTLTPADAGSPTTDVINNFVTNIQPTEALVNRGYQSIQHYNYLTGPFGIANYTHFNQGFQINNAGDFGSLIFNNEYAAIGDGTNVSTSQGFTGRNAYYQVAGNHDMTNGFQADNISMTVATDAVVDYINGRSYGLQIDGESEGNIFLFNNNVNITNDQPSGVGLFYYQNTSNIDGDLQNIGGIGFGFNIGQNAPTTILTNTQVFQSSAHLYADSTMGGYAAFTDNSTFEAGSFLTGGYSGISITPNIASDLSGQSVFYGNFSGSIGDASTPVTLGSINGVIVNTNVVDNTTVDNGITVFQDAIQFHSGSTADYYISAGLTPTFHSGTTIENITMLNVNPTLDSTTTTNLTLAQITANGAGSATNLKGISLSLTQVDSPNKKQAITSEGGSFNASYQVNTGDFSLAFADNIHGMGGFFHIDSGSPIGGGAFIFGNNIGYLFVAEDDFGVDALGGVIGFSMNASVGQVLATSTSTVDTLNFFIAGASVPDPTLLGTTDGGTFTNIVLYRALGILPQGGTITIDNLYGYKVESFFDAAPATNIWGFHNGSTTSHNFMHRLALSTSNEKTSTNVKLEMNDGHWKHTQTTPPAIAADANAGTSASASVNNATDLAGGISLTTGSAAWAAGTQLTLTFDDAFNVAPRAVLTPKNIYAAQVQYYVTTTTTTLTISFVNADVASTTYEWDYVCIETQ